MYQERHTHFDMSLKRYSFGTYKGALVNGGRTFLFMALKGFKRLQYLAVHGSLFLCSKCRYRRIDDATLYGGYFQRLGSIFNIGLPSIKVILSGRTYRPKPFFLSSGNKASLILEG